MAARKGFEARSGEIRPPPQAARTGAGIAAIERFGARLGELTDQLFELHTSKLEREQALAGTSAGVEGTFVPRRTGTRPDNAFDRAGMAAHLERLKIAVGDQVTRIYEENQHDPAKLETALDGYRKGTQAEILKSTPEIADDFMEFYDRSTRPYRRAAAADYQRGQLQQNVAALSDALASLSRQGEQRAYLSDGSPEAVEDISVAREQYLKRLVDSGPQGAFVLGGKKFDADPTRAGAIDVDTIQKEIYAYDRAIIGARYKGEYNRAAKTGRGEKFIEGFQKNDKLLGEISIAERDELARWMRGQETAAEAVRNANDRALNTAVDAAIGAIRAGETPGDLDALRGRTRGSVAGERLRLAVENQDRVQQFLQMPPTAQAAAIEAERKAMKGLRTGGDDEGYARETAAATDRIQAFEQGQKATMESLKRDPFGHMIAVGNIGQPPDLVNPETGLLNEASLTYRAGEARRMSELYGFTVPPMTTAEIDAFGQLQAGADPVRRGMNLDTLMDTMGGDQALTLLQRMDEKGYVVDAAAGSMILDDAPELAQMIYQGDSILAPFEGKPSPYKFPDTDFDPAFAAAMGTTYVLNPRAEFTAREAVKRVLVASRARANKRPDAELEQSEVEAAVRAVMGGELIRVGGRGGTTVTPPFRGATEDDFTDWWGSIDAAAVKAAGGMAGWKDDAAADLIKKRGLPVELEQGVYAIAVPGAGELDLTRTAKNNEGRPLVLRFARPR